MRIGAGVWLVAFCGTGAATTVEVAAPSPADRVPAPFVQHDGVRVPTWSAPLTAGPDEVLVAAAEDLLDDLPADEPAPLHDSALRVSFGDTPLRPGAPASARPLPAAPDGSVWTPPLLMLAAGAALVLAAVLRRR